MVVMIAARECVDLLTALHLAGRRILVLVPVGTEVGYLLAKAGQASRRSF